MSETLRAVAEDAFLTAAKLRTLDGDYLDEDGNLDYFRVAEIVLNLGERIVDCAGIPHETVWTPDAVLDMLDSDYGHRGKPRPRLDDFVGPHAATRYRTALAEWEAEL